MFSTLPNRLTLLRVLLVPVFLLLLFSPSPLLKLVSGAVFGIASATDYYDGYLARRMGHTSRWGRFLDPLADKILTSAAFISFGVLGIVPWWMVVVILGRDILITAIRSYAEFLDQPLKTSYSAKIKTFVQLGLQVYLLALVILAAQPGIPTVAASARRLLMSPVNWFLLLTVTLFTAWTGLSYLVSDWPTVRAVWAHLSGRRLPAPESRRP